MRDFSYWMALARYGWTRAVGIGLLVVAMTPMPALAGQPGACAQEYANYERVFNKVKGTSREPKFIYLYEKDRVESYLEYLNGITDLDDLREKRQYFVDNPQVLKEEFPDDLLAVHARWKQCVTEQRIAVLTGSGGAPSSRSLPTRAPDDATSTAGGGMRGAESATGGTIGQNRGKGGNPDWMYDDIDHGKCVSVQPTGQNTGSGLAYGHYQLINGCSYPIKLRTCITTDRADGTPTPTFDQHQDGQKCPGMGWLGGDLEANEVTNGKEWFEYSHIKWDIQACRADWSFVGPDGQTYPGPLLGEPYGCRRRRP